MRRRAARVFALALAAFGGLLACNGNPTRPSDGPLAIGRWTGVGACLSVTDIECNLAVDRARTAGTLLRCRDRFTLDPERDPEGSLPPASYSVTLTTAGMCPFVCV